MDPLIPQDWRQLTATQRDILTALANNPNATVSDISETIGHTPSFQTISRNLSTLRDKRFVKSETDDGDERKRRSELTEQGIIVVRMGVLQVADELQNEE